MKLGIGSYTYGWAVGIQNHRPENPMDEIEIVDRAQAFGLSVVQIGDNLPLHTFSTQRLERLAQRASVGGMEIEIGARGLTPSRIAAYVKIAARIGSKLIRFIIDEPGYCPSPVDIISILRLSLNRLGDTAIAIENHDRLPSRQLRQILDAVDDPRVGLCLDTANSLGAGQGLDTILTYLSRHTINVHLKDVRIERVASQMGFTVEGCPAGRGLIDFRDVVDRIDHEGRCRNAIVELWTPPGSSIDSTLKTESVWAEESVEHLKRIVGRPAAK